MSKRIIAEAAPSLRLDSTTPKREGQVTGSSAEYRRQQYLVLFEEVFLAGDGRRGRVTGVVDVDDTLCLHLSHRAHDRFSLFAGGHPVDKVGRGL
jgi:hypothetical protein